MLALAYRLVGSQREAEDLVHDVFLEAWQSARQYDAKRGRVRTWFLLRLRSRAIDRSRRQKHAARVEFDEARLRLATEHSDDPSTLRDRLSLRRIVRGLPPDLRTVLELAYFAGYSCAEMAHELAIPIGTVKSRMARALATLRLRLQAPEGGGS